MTLFCVKKMRAICVNANAVFVDEIVCVSSDMGAFIDNVRFKSSLGKLTSMDGSGEARSDDQNSFTIHFVAPAFNRSCESVAFALRNNVQ